MEGRCAVETWAELGFSGTSCTTKVKFGFGTDVFLCSGSDEVYVFSTQERKLTAVLQFSGPVSDLVESHDKQLLYVACGSGVYCVSLQFLQSRAHSSPANASSSPTELKIPSEFLVVPEEGVLSLLLVGSLLLTVSQRDASWMLTLYNSPNQSESSSYEMLSSFSLPLVSGVVHAGMRRPALICVHSSDTTPPSSYSTSSSEAMLTNGHVRLEPVLFKLLFGIDAALAKSPVILCGLPDGCLCFLPLRPPGSRLRVLHSLEQPVVFVGASVVMETGPGHAQCLVAVGELGRVVLIKTDKGGPEGGGNIAGFIERCVPGPVMCGCVDTNCLYYSTGSDLLGLDLSERSSGREGQERVEETGAALQSPISLNVCRVIALAEPTCNTEGPGGVKTGHQGDKIALSSSVVHARGPNGHTVKLTAKEVNVGEESVGKEESLTTVEVQVESSSIAAVCGLHHAVLRRVQTLLQRAPERAACTQRVQSLGLRQALQRAEHLLQQIQQCRVSGAFGVGVSTGQMTRSLLSVYRELRENPFFII
ncbi:Fanconi anemia core complex-associated protein 100 isoform X3 [Siniperca chuatsi]|uniref:Fanconi anemia core complex-associated protein 100 isoform X3 n=1 Tax=Siniperca chuatsi TaxID=119488 RepID=UPI001CE029A9|nr:Fanconi anemia core complex-associated protein 100 isoform X3 [Siniperca chuatsi]